MTAALCIRPADCLGGNKAFLDAYRGVRAAPAPAPAPRRPMPKQDGQVPTTASTFMPGQSRPVRGRPNGRQPGRRSPPAAAGSPTQKLVMENVVILKRGEQFQPKVTGVAAKSNPQAEKADEHVAAANQRGAQAEKVVAAADEYSTRAEKSGMVNAGPVIAADQHGPDTPAKKAEAAEQHSADTTKAKVLAAADLCVPPAKEKEDKRLPAAAAGGNGMKAEAAPPVVYSGSSLIAAPEPRELPVPVLLLKGRGARLGSRD